jgi:hypothetical protein
MGLRNFWYRFGEDLVHKPGSDIENAGLSDAVLLHTLATVSLSDVEDTSCGGFETTYRTPDNEQVAGHEHRPGICLLHARFYRGPSFELAGPLANGSGEVPLQVELKTIRYRNVWDHFKLA